MTCLDCRRWRDHVSRKDQYSRFEKHLKHWLAPREVQSIRRGIQYQAEEYLLKAYPSFTRDAKEGADEAEP